MTVAKLIEELSRMPADCEVWHLWDGESRTQIQHVWLARNNTVVTADHGEVCYGLDDRPLLAPTPAEEPYWSTPGAEETGAKKQ